MTIENLDFNTITLIYNRYILSDVNEKNKIILDLMDLDYEYSYEKDFMHILLINLFDNSFLRLVNRQTNPDILRKKLIDSNNRLLSLKTGDINSRLRSETNSVDIKELNEIKDELILVSKKIENIIQHIYNVYSLYYRQG